MKYRPTIMEGSCCFELWDKKKKELSNCNSLSHIKCGQKYICKKHFPYVVSFDQKGEIILSSETFLKKIE